MATRCSPPPAPPPQTPRESLPRLKVFDVAQIDGRIVPIVGHWVVLLPRLPWSCPSTCSSDLLYYDPAISLGKLVGSNIKDARQRRRQLSATVTIPIMVAVVVMATGRMLTCAREGNGHLRQAGGPCTRLQVNLQCPTFLFDLFIIIIFIDSTLCHTGLLLTQPQHQHG